MLVVSLVSLFLAVPALARPTVPTTCSISTAKLSLPSNQTALVPPTSAPHFIALGVGVQNYTCNATSLTYTNVGAVAELFDIQCLYGTNVFESITTDVFKAWSIVPSFLTTQAVIAVLGSAPTVLGQHYFIPNSPAPSPKWDFTSDAEKGNPEAFVVGASVGSIPSPASKDDINWVQLKKVEGELADSVYRVETAGGQPPASCTAGAPLLSVKYTAQYWFFGGSIHPPVNSV
jgi:hypothetical protein